MIWNQFCYVYVSVPVAYFSNFQNDKNRNGEVDKVSNNVEVHDDYFYG